MELFLTLLILYSKMIIGVLIGIFFQLIAKDKSMKDKDKEVEGDHLSGVLDIYKTRSTLDIQKLRRATLLFLIIGEAINPETIGIHGSLEFWGFIIPKKVVYEGVLVMLFSTVGYVGQDYALRIYSYTNTKLNKDIAQAEPKK